MTSSVFSDLRKEPFGSQDAFFNGATRKILTAAENEEKNHHGYRKH
jgi:hypothetical protein